MSNERNRDPKGIPTGGQFAAGKRSEGDETPLTVSRGNDLNSLSVAGRGVAVLTLDSYGSTTYDLDEFVRTLEDPAVAEAWEAYHAGDEHDAHHDGRAARVAESAMAVMRANAGDDSGIDEMGRMQLVSEQWSSLDDPEVEDRRNHALAYALNGPDLYEGDLSKLEYDENLGDDGQPSGARGSFARFEDEHLNMGHLDNAVMHHATFTNVSWQEASLAGAQLNGSRFTSCTLRDTSFEKTSLAKAHMVDVTIGAPYGDGLNVERSMLNKVDIDDAELNEVRAIESGWSEVSLRRGSLHDVDFACSHLDRVNCIDTRISSLRLHDTDWDAGDLRKVELESAEVDDSRLRRLDMSEAQISTSSFADTDLSDVTLNNAAVERSEFADCSFTGSTKAHEAAFTDCTFTRVDAGQMAEGSLQGATFTNCTFDDESTAEWFRSLGGTVNSAH